MSSLNFVCKPYQSSKVLSLVADSKGLREPNIKMVGILKINCTYCASLEGVGFSTVYLIGKLVN